MSVSEEIIFDGGEGQCERFIRLVRKTAFSQGKLDDSKWVAMFASTCFEGKALRWYSALDPATKTDWNMMEPALLSEFTGPVLNSQPEEKILSTEREGSIPTPAAAPPPPPFVDTDESSRAPSPISYEPAPAAAAPPAPVAPPDGPSTPSQGQPPPPPPPRNNTNRPSAGTGSNFRPPPPRHSASSSDSSSYQMGGPGLYGSYIPGNNPGAAPPPPPRNSSFGSRRDQDDDIPKNTPSRENTGRAEATGYPNAAGGVTFPNWGANASGSVPQPSSTPSNNAPPPPPPKYSGRPEPQSEPSRQPPPPPPPRREPQPPPPPPRREPSTPSTPQQGYPYPSSGPEFPSVPPQFTGQWVPPQFTGPGPTSVPPQYTGGPWPGQQQQQYQPPPPPPPSYWAPTQPIRGRIRVMDPSGGSYWVRQSLNWFGGFKRTSKLAEAAVVQWDSIKEPGRLRLLSPINQQPWIGLTWASTPRGMLPALGKGSSDHADMAAVGESPLGITTSASHREGSSFVDIWNLGTDMKLNAQVIGPYGMKHSLEVAVGSGTKWIWFVSDFDTFSLSNVGQIRSALVFEAL